MADLPILAQEEPVKKKPGRPFGSKKKGVNAISQEVLDGLMAKMKDLEQKLATQGRNGAGIETASQRLLNRHQTPEPSQEEVQEKIHVVDQPATEGGHMIKNACPYCRKFHSDQPTILDLTNSNKYACRRCGKHWEKWAIAKSDLTDSYYPYSEALEKGDKKRVEYHERIKMAKDGMAVGVVEGENEEG